MYFHAKDLRKGRYSKSGFVYLLTTITHDRREFFLSFKAARILINTLKAADQKQLSTTIGFVVMPDHLHWLMELGRNANLSETVRFVKGTSAYKINSYLEALQFRWQDGFHDHALRRDEDMVACMRYIIANPLRAGLVKKIGNYPHWDCIYI